MNRFAFLCGGIANSTVDTDVRCIEMDVQGQQTVNLRIADISRAMVQNLPDLFLDLLEIAAYVHCGDQRANRGSEKLTRAGSQWCREMRFKIPVRRPEIWSGAQLREELEGTLGYLSDDLYEFEFVEAKRPLTEPMMYFADLAEGGFEADDVVLFSGGLDSLAGAIDRIAVEGRRTVLVAHHSADKTLAVQKQLVGELRRAGHGARLLHVPVNVTNTDIRPSETTQRSRSFLFASLAFVIARMFGKDRFTFFENGVVSLNLPIARDVLGARATRTTHPRVIEGFERIFSMLAERDVAVDTPYLWLTKKEIVERIVSAGFGPSIAKSVSCVHPMIWTREVRHCGRCSQCIDRRFAVLAADARQFDPAEGYAIDLLTGPREDDQDLRLAIAYVKFWLEISKSTRERFPVDHPDVYSALRYLPGITAESGIDRIWDLHRRQAESVQKVIEAGLRAHATALIHDELALGALLRLCFSRNRIESQPLADPSAQVTEFLDRLAQPVCDFSVDDEAGQIRFRGGFSLAGADYRLVAALLPNFRSAKSRVKEVGYFYPPDLADALEIEEPALRARITRLRKVAEERLAVDQGIHFPDGFIENLHGKGYRLAPELREVSLGDLERSKTAMSQTD